jgi:hypothetical protein
VGQQQKQTEHLGVGFQQVTISKQAKRNGICRSGQRKSFVKCQFLPADGMCQ